MDPPLLPCSRFHLLSRTGSVIQLVQLNGLVHGARVRARHTRRPASAIGDDPAQNKKLGVTNRDTWTVKPVHRNGAVDFADGTRPNFCSTSEMTSNERACGAGGSR